MKRSGAGRERYGPRGSVPSGCGVQATLLFGFLLLFYLATLFISSHSGSLSNQFALPTIENTQSSSGDPADAVGFDPGVVLGSY